MAQFESDINDLIEALRKADLFDEESQSRLLQAGADHLMKHVKAEASKSKYNLRFVSSKLKKNKLKRDKNGEYYVTVTIKGKNARGERLATIAFVLNYGRQKKYGGIEGNYFWTEAVKQASDSVAQVYERETEKIFKERGLT